jgi:hypothetical protein
LERYHRELRKYLDLPPKLVGSKPLKGYVGEEKMFRNIGDLQEDEEQPKEVAAVQRVVEGRMRVQEELMRRGEMVRVC